MAQLLVNNRILFLRLFKSTTKAFDLGTLSCEVVKLSFTFASNSIAVSFVNTRLSEVVTMADDSSYSVKLYIYDISKGMARQMSFMMLGEFLKFVVLYFCVYDI